MPKSARAANTPTRKQAMLAHDLLVEIGTEELPPKALKSLSTAFAQSITLAVEKSGLTYDEALPYATPRRLGLLLNNLISKQPDKEIERRGPALSAAFDAEGNVTPAAEGFARSCGVTIDALERLETPKGRWLIYRSREKGQATAELLPEIVRGALAKLPIPKRMRWGAGEEEFIRPVHWVVLLYGDATIRAEILGVLAGHATRGHRFHHPAPIELTNASEYASVLEKQGYVIPAFDERRERIRKQVQDAAKTIHGVAVINNALLDEVAALVEWPNTLTGSFDKAFLALPAEILIATMADKLKYFHVVDSQSQLMPHFIAVYNIESRDPDVVRAGNERVIRPRLSDAAFFWEQDRATPLAKRRSDLKGVIFQSKLGTLYEKSDRVLKLADKIASALGANRSWARRAGELSKNDLFTQMVGEFPELQGIMGRYYAINDGEPEEVAQALDEQYMPRFAGDELPRTSTGQGLALADKLDTLVGIFGIGNAPSGDKDPFGLRRAALGCLRILIEGELDLDLEQLLVAAAKNYSPEFKTSKVSSEVYDFMMERLRSYYLEDGIGTDVFEAVLARRPTRPYDFHRRIRAVADFRGLPEAKSLAAANKRIRNILKQAGGVTKDKVEETLLDEPAERHLATRLAEIDAKVRPLLEKSDYTGALTQLAGLRDSVDAFFDDVLVMCEDEALKNNRLALLKNLSTLFLEAADISRLQG
jgi:glycyl-tRNA synthetase beta chain